MSLALMSQPVRAGGTAVVIYQGVPDRRVVWSLTGPGTLVPVTDYTDHAGRAAAVFTPAAAGDSVIIEVSSSA